MSDKDKVSAELFKNPPFILLKEGEIMESGDEYYNPFLNKWLPIEEEFIGNEFITDESKPIRRKTK